MTAKPLLPLRDQLALDRTELANRRTWLASARTSLAMFICGVSFVQFFDAEWLGVLGWGFVALSLPLLTIGYRGYVQEREQLKMLAEDARRLLEAS